VTVRYALLLVIVVGSIVVLGHFGGNGLPFDIGEVSCIRFRYAVSDSEQIVIHDPVRVKSILKSLKVEPGVPCTMCDYEESVVLTISGVDHVAVVDSHDLIFQGEYRGSLRMKPGFYELMDAYRDSSQYREPWESHYIEMVRSRRQKQGG
jgi:hypothetical protein